MKLFQPRQELAHSAALITGGSRGIGLATARAFLREGARVVLLARDPKRLAAAQEELSQLGEVEAVVGNVRVIDHIQDFVDKARQRFGRIDVLVNNAGRARSGDFVSEDITTLDEIIDVNIKGVLYTTHAVLPVMLAQRSGVIINVSSGAGLTGFAGLATYCASKFAVVGFTESLAQEVAQHGIRVYGVCPGRVATDMQEEVSGRRIGIPPERVARKIIDLVQDNRSLRTGKCPTVS
jgi:3-oxoacyl-[acyl-carrier protein] reductase